MTRRQTSTILVTWLCFSGEKGEHMWSHSTAWFNNGVFCKQQKANSHSRESFRGSILESIIAGCKRKLSVEVFGASTKMVDSETTKCEQQALPAKSARRKECDHVRSPFRFDKQSHVTEIVNFFLHNLLSLLSVNSRSTCFVSRFHVAVRLFSNRSQMTSKCGENKKVTHWCSYHILTSSVIYYWTDARQHGIYLFYIIL